MSGSDRLCAIVAQRLGRDTVAVTDHFIEDLGIESIDMVVLAARINEVFGITLSDDALWDATTVGDLWAAIESAQS